jgi:hypothetical protein
MLIEDLSRAPTQVCRPAEPIETRRPGGHNGNTRGGLTMGEPRNLQTLSADELSEAEQRAAKQRGSRTCGTCTACCTILGVVELNKPNYSPCSHECKAGCAIYSTRPVSCRVWSCNWLYGREPAGDERRRPDKLGLMFTHEDIGRRGKILTAYEVWPGAAMEAPAAFLLRKLTGRGQFILVLSGGGPGRGRAQVIGPPGCQAGAAELAEEIKSLRQRELETHGDLMRPLAEAPSSSTQPRPDVDA